MLAYIKFEIECYFDVKRLFKFSNSLNLGSGCIKAVTYNCVSNRQTRKSLHLFILAPHSPD